MKALGTLLIVLVLAALAYQGFTYTSREKVLDIGPIACDRGAGEDRVTAPDRGGYCGRQRSGAAGRRRSKTGIKTNAGSALRGEIRLGERPAQAASLLPVGD
jgi:hypothetical protein